MIVGIKEFPLHELPLLVTMGTASAVSAHVNFWNFPFSLPLVLRCHQLNSTTFTQINYTLCLGTGGKVNL